MPFFCDLVLRVSGLSSIIVRFLFSPSASPSMSLVALSWSNNLEGNGSVILECMFTSIGLDIALNFRMFCFVTSLLTSGPISAPLWYAARVRRILSSKRLSTGVINLYYKCSLHHLYPILLLWWCLYPTNKSTVTWAVNVNPVSWLIWECRMCHFILAQGNGHLWDFLFLDVAYYSPNIVLST